MRGYYKCELMKMYAKIFAYRLIILLRIQSFFKSLNLISLNLMSSDVIKLYVVNLIFHIHTRTQSEKQFLNLIPMNLITRFLIKKN